MGHSARDIGRIEGFCLGVEFGKAIGGLEPRLKHATMTMAEVDAHYEGLLREIKEMREQLKAADRGQRTDDSQVI